MKSGRKTARVRFAPSPTGHLHVGGARTALFNWLFARHKGGSFILRVEDTDLARSARELEENILQDLSWLGLDWDEGPGIGGERGPYRQSERLDIYKKYSGILKERGVAYSCFCTDRELKEKRDRMAEEGLPPRYDGTCRDLSPEEMEKKREEGRPESVRFDISGQGEWRLDDLIRGEVVFPPGMVGDFVIVRSNGLPTYNFAAAVDDTLMEITHVIRGEEHLSNTLRQMMIYQALGFSHPRFAHIPLILGSDRSKLSKRHGAPNVEDYRIQGYPPEAVVNYLALLGWSPGDEREIMSLRELIQSFHLDRVSQSPSIFDMKKLNWFSSEYIRAGGADRYFDAAREYFPDEFLEEYDNDSLEEMFQVISEDLDCFSQIGDKVKAFSPGIPPLDLRQAGQLKENSRLFAALVEELDNCRDWEEGEIFQAIKSAGKKAGFKGRHLYMPLRIGVSGMEHGPNMVKVMKIKGKRNVIESLRRFIRRGD